MKKMKKYCLIISFVILIFSIYFFIRPVIIEANEGDDLLNEMQSGANSVMSRGENKFESLNVNINFAPITGVVTVLYLILCAVLIAGTIYKGVSYGLSNASDRATEKEGLIRWVILCVLGIGAVQVWKLMISVFSDSTDTANIVNQFENTVEGLEGSYQNSTFWLIINTILRVIQVGGIGYVVVRFTVVGIKYFSKSATAADKAEVKNGELQKTLRMAVIVFGAVGFFELIYQAFYGSSE